MFILLGLGLLGAAGLTHVWYTQIAPQIAPRMLGEVFAGVSQTVEKIFASDSTGLIAFAALYASWAASGVVRACMGALNRIYETDETRSWATRYPLSVALGLVLIVALLGAILLIVAGKHWGGGSAHLPVTIALARRDRACRPRLRHPRPLRAR